MVMPEGKYIVRVITVFDVLDALFILAGLLLYYCSIRMLRSSIAKCTSFKFETAGTYIICSLYCFILALQLIYMILYR